MSWTVRILIACGILGIIMSVIGALQLIATVL